MHAGTGARDVRTTTRAKAPQISTGAFTWLVVSYPPLQLRMLRKLRTGTDAVACERIVNWTRTNCARVHPPARHATDADIARRSATSPIWRCDADLMASGAVPDTR